MKARSAVDNIQKRIQEADNFTGKKNRFSFIIILPHCFLTFKIIIKKWLI